MVVGDRKAKPSGNLQGSLSNKLISLNMHECYCEYPIPMCMFEKDFKYALSKFEPKARVQIFCRLCGIFFEFLETMLLSLKADVFFTIHCFCIWVFYFALALSYSIKFLPLKTLACDF